MTVEELANRLSQQTGWYDSLCESRRAGYIRIAMHVMKLLEAQKSAVRRPNAPHNRAALHAYNMRKLVK